MLSSGTVNLVRDVSGSNVQLRSGGTAGDAFATVADGAQLVNAFLRGWNGTTWDRVDAGQYNANGLAGSGDGGLIVNAMLRGHNGSTWDLIREAQYNANALAFSADGAISANAITRLSNGASFDLGQAASAANQATSSLTNLPGILLATDPGNWFSENFPATGVAAVATRAAGGAGVRHVLTSVNFSISGAPALATALLRCTVLDGGAIVFSSVLSAPINTTATIIQVGMSIVGTANQTMTIQFSAGGGAGTQESVTMTGYSTV